MPASSPRFAPRTRISSVPFDPSIPDDWQLSGVADAPELCAAIGRNFVPGVDVVLAFDAAGWMELVVPLGVDEPLEGCVDLVAQVVDRGSLLVVVSNRTHQVPADRPGDELVYEEIRGAALAHDVVLLDWFVIAGTKAFSLAEFAPSGPGWDQFRPNG